MLLGIALIAVVDLVLVASGVIGIAARKRVSGAVTSRQMLGPAFRIAAGAALLVVLAVLIAVRH
jgi:hypothetical protein